MTLNALNRDSGLKDGFTVFLPGGDCVILYNDKVKSHYRKNFTIAHELGHIHLGHASDGPLRELEADTFAAELLMPRILLREMHLRCGHSISYTELSSLFRVSRQAARIRLEELDFTRSPFSTNELNLLGRYKGIFPDSEHYVTAPEKTP